MRLVRGCREGTDGRGLPPAGRWPRSWTWRPCSASPSRLRGQPAPGPGPDPREHAAPGCGRRGAGAAARRFDADIIHANTPRAGLMARSRGGWAARRWWSGRTSTCPRPRWDAACGRYWRTRPARSSGCRGGGAQVQRGARAARWRPTSTTASTARASTPTGSSRAASASGLASPRRRHCSATSRRSRRGRPRTTRSGRWRLLNRSG